MAFSSDDLPTPLCPATTLARPDQRPVEPLDAEAGFRAQQEHFVAHLGVHSRQRFQAGGVHQVDLVDADQRPGGPFLGGHQQAVDQVRLQPGLGGAADDGHLVDVGHQDLLPAADRPADAPLSRLDPLDEPFLGVGVFHGAKQHAVPRRHHVPLIGGQGLQQPAGRAPVDVAVLVLDHAVEPEHTKHSAATAELFVHVQVDGQAGLVATLLLSAHGASPSEFPFAADAFVFLGGLLLESVLPVRAASSPTSGRGRRGSCGTGHGFSSSWPSYVARTRRVRAPAHGVCRLH